MFKLLRHTFAVCLPSLLLGGVVAGEVQVGFGEVDITPDVKSGKPVWIAGYGQNRKATDVHDSLFARCLVLKEGDKKIALAVADVVGLQYDTVQSIRKQLSDFTYVMVSSTHNHEGPDTIGIWGPSIARSGIDPRWLSQLEQKMVEIIRQAESSALPAAALYGTAEDETLLRDSRQPYVFDGVLRALKFQEPKSNKVLGIAVQWNCHPESMGGDNTVVTADFPYAAVELLKERYNCPVVYFTGPLGGLMAPPRDKRIKNAEGKFLGEGDFEFCRLYGKAVGELAAQAIDAAEPINLSGFVASAKTISVPLENPLYRAARMLGVLKRTGRVWTGNCEELGELISAKTAKDAMPAGETEVAYIRLGELHIACIPGEIYPESVYGKYQDPVDPGADFPDAPLEKPILEILPGKKALVIGLANDELGYILPKRQWDARPPFAYGRDKDQYGEENSVGPDTAPILYGALERRVREAQGQ